MLFGLRPKFCRTANPLVLNPVTEEAAEIVGQPAEHSVKIARPLPASIAFDPNFAASSMAFSDAGSKTSMPIGSPCYASSHALPNCIFLGRSRLLNVD